jgi:hypothetical protein
MRLGAGFVVQDLVGKEWTFLRSFSLFDSLSSWRCSLCGFVDARGDCFFSEGVGSRTGAAVSFCQNRVKTFRRKSGEKKPAQPTLQIVAPTPTDPT